MGPSQTSGCAVWEPEVGVSVPTSSISIASARELNVTGNPCFAPPGIVSKVSATPNKSRINQFEEQDT